MTTGEKIVRIDFNASGSDDVYQFKKDVADLINRLEAISHKDERLYKKVESILEDASCYGVKLITAK